MKSLNKEEISSPPGIFSSLKAGFDITANKPSIMLFPILLDFFLWLGPKLQINSLLQAFIRQIEIFAKEGDTPASDLQHITDTVNDLISLNLNLFGILRTLPIGVSSLLGKIDVPLTPLGKPAVYQIQSLWVFFPIFGSLLFFGWVFGSVYFAWVARVALKEDTKLLTWFGKTVSQSTLLSIFLMIVLLAFGFPLLVLFSLLLQINPSVAQVLLFLSVLFAMWLVVPVFFAAHGIFVKKENLFRSMLSAFQLSRFSLSSSNLFVIGTVILSQGFNALWLSPSGASWMMLVGIFGHAFITTALLAASFIYYRDMNVWLETFLEKLKSKQNSVQA